MQHNAPRGQKTASGREAEFFEVFVEELGGGRPPPLAEVRPQEKYTCSSCHSSSNSPLARRSSMSCRAADDG